MKYLAGHKWLQFYSAFTVFSRIYIISTFISMNCFGTKFVVWNNYFSKCVQLFFISEQTFCRWNNLDHTFTTFNTLSIPWCDKLLFNGIFDIEHLLYSISRFSKHFLVQMKSIIFRLNEIRFISIDCAFGMQVND